MKRLCTFISLVMVSCLPATTYGSGFGNWPANSGGFSYSFVNLSGADCNLSAFGGNPNPATGNSTSGYSSLEQLGISRTRRSRVLYLRT